MGVVLKRAHYFITCNGKMMYKTLIDEKYISDRLISLNNKENWQHSYSPERQLSLFEDFGVS
jgi:radical SAM domain protein